MNLFYKQMWSTGFIWQWRWQQRAHDVLFTRSPEDIGKHKRTLCSSTKPFKKSHHYSKTQWSHFISTLPPLLHLMFCIRSSVVVQTVHAVVWSFIFTISLTYKSSFNCNISKFGNVSLFMVFYYFGLIWTRVRQATVNIYPSIPLNTG
jgi:hypothetical protein